MFWTNRKKEPSISDRLHDHKLRKLEEDVKKLKFRNMEEDGLGLYLAHSYFLRAIVSENYIHMVATNTYNESDYAVNLSIDETEKLIKLLQQCIAKTQKKK